MIQTFVGPLSKTDFPISLSPRCCQMDPDLERERHEAIDSVGTEDSTVRTHGALAIYSHIEPENQRLEASFPVGMAYFEGSMLVFGGVCYTGVFFSPTLQWRFFSKTTTSARKKHVASWASLQWLVAGSPYNWVIGSKISYIKQPNSLLIPHQAVIDI